MKTILAAIAVVVLASAALADTAYTITNMSCAQVQAAVKSSGSAILHYRSKSNPGLPIYSRYVSDARFCDNRETISFASVPTADKKSCTVKKCISTY
ncbi:hypothetical protein RB623_29880 [Mesorhizobium sp. LHD-90]|uniref:hypothetical protein n=1 Tax=Mesorhizobium sp. LHD-90 TaxID=3071414 RepID=UPI0027E01DAB|nr:hypothetical protein [Mesorhizobium sp. LHD-90]MDQ6438277.1 hypothetical protein [Mesorhizobium sp. LHD-90]